MAYVWQGSAFEVHLRRLCVPGIRYPWLSVSLSLFISFARSLARSLSLFSSLSRSLSLALAPSLMREQSMPLMCCLPSSLTVHPLVVVVQPIERVAVMCCSYNLPYLHQPTLQSSQRVA